MLKEFEAYKLFEIKKGKRLTKADMKPGNINFIGSTSVNNGVTAKIGNTKYLHPAHTITVSYNGSVGEAFLQDEQFWASDDVNVWYPRFKFNNEIMIYIMTVIKKLSTKYSYTAKWTIDKMRAEKLILPVIESSDPDHEYTIDDIDYEYMQDRIAELEQDRITELDAYLKATGLDDYELTEEDREVLSIDTTQVKRKNFLLGDLFTAFTGDVDLQQKDINDKGEYFVNSGVTNLGIKGKTDRPAKVFPANTITIDFWGNAYYRDFEYKLATHNHVFSLTGEIIKNRLVGLYLVSLLSEFPKLFSYNNMATWNKLKKMKIALPITSAGEVDYAYMENYIRAMEKVTIADVVKYKDKVIETTKAVVEQ